MLVRSSVCPSIRPQIPYLIFRFQPLSAHFGLIQSILGLVEGSEAELGAMQGLFDGLEASSGTILGPILIVV